MVYVAEQKNRAEKIEHHLIGASIRISGIVQGVGFRPFVYNLAHKYNVKGFVINDEKGVFIDVEGPEENLSRFLRGLQAPPSIAQIEKIETEFHDLCGYEFFKIEKSKRSGEKFTFISPDVATCNDCLKELFDPLDRRYLYPFINCTNCGPRFTIIKDIPYDRPSTTMAAFDMCSLCAEEYHNPTDRRFHAQPTACPRCGPSVTLVKNDGSSVIDGDPIEKTVAFLKQGKIVAIKGLGGFHLACDAYNEKAVNTLRSRKYREDKPFALMCRDIHIAKKVCEIDEKTEKMLTGPQRPIVVLRKRSKNPVASSVAPGHINLGVMLPYTPLHHLLFAHEIEALVMTSGNLSDEPIVYKNDDALERLSGIADFFLLNDRDIHIRCDDSVVKPIGGKETFFRRARGYVPFPIRLKHKGNSVLACGAELKNTFCLTKGEYAFVSHHIGDLENWETFTAFEGGIEHFKRLFEIKPKMIVYDLHPDYLSTQYALSQPLPKIGVQHHFTHALSCMAEYHLEGPLLAVIMDGTGYGEDGSAWGCEFFKVCLDGYERLGHLRYVPLPGSEKAIKEPWRMGAMYLDRIYGDEWTKFDLPISKAVSPGTWSFLKKSVGLNLNSPLCSSAGRLFDAVSAILGIRNSVNYEGQAAIELEQLASVEEDAYPFDIAIENNMFVLNPDPAISAIVEEIHKGEEIETVAGRFHTTVSKMIQKATLIMREKTGLSQVILSGGVFQNHLLLGRSFELLKNSGFEIYTNHKVPANDGGISLGQAYYGSFKS